jgi:signal transduction histidine kinase
VKSPTADPGVEGSIRSKPQVAFLAGRRDAMRRIKFYRGLRFKIIMGVVTLLTFTMSILFALQYFNHRKKMIHHLQEDISPHLTQMVNDVLRSAMLSKNLGEMKYILEVASSYPDVKKMFILDRVGKIVVSIDDREVGKRIDLRDPTCQVCHRHFTEALNKTVIYSAPGGEKIFRNVNPIYNRAECFVCHSPQQKITGVLVTDFTLNNVEKQLRAELGSNLLFLLLAVGASTLVIGITLNQMVIKKLERFVEAASLLGSGNFKGIIHFESDDEIKRLADSFNVMARTLEDKMQSERKYISRIIDAQENERKRISRELHDEVGQALTAIKFNLDMIDRDLPQTLPFARGRLGEAKALSNHILASMRRLSTELRPSMLDELGLIPTLRWYIQNFSNRLNLYTRFEAIGIDEKLPPQIETAFYRIVQEALNNTAKHAGADRIEVSFQKRNSTISVSIRDNGKGFDLDEVLHPQSPERGFGLVGMQERVSLLGGSIEIHTQPGMGTQIQIDVPCRNGE